MESRKPHALVLCFPQQGHINPLMQISNKLAAEGFIITFIVSLQDYARMTKAKGNSNHPNGDDTSQIRLVGVSDGCPYQYPESWSSFEKGFRESYDSMMHMKEGVYRLMQEGEEQKLLRQDHPPTVLLADIFVSWAHELATKLGIPLAGFFTSNTLGLSTFYHARSLYSKGILPFRNENGTFFANDPVTCMPGVPPLHPKDFPIDLTYKASHYRFQFVLDQYANFLQSTAILINTFEELESSTIAALQQELNIYPVGPLFLLDGGKNGDPAKADVSYWTAENDCLCWLDTQQPSSILYISFGSVAFLPIQHIRELAMGLEASEQPFLWVIRSDNVNGSLWDVLPEGFLSRTETKGRVISWAPQISVLSHLSIGGFLSHCGWNSVLENISTGAVPMLCWPQVAEQRLNCRTLVDIWKIGMEFERREEDGKVENGEIERVIRELMHGEKGKEMKSRLLKLKESALNAGTEGGSSHRNMEAFIAAFRDQIEHSAHPIET